MEHFRPLRTPPAQSDGADYKIKPTHDSISSSIASSFETIKRRPKTPQIPK